jgi:endoribonuclease Dicer
MVDGAQDAHGFESILGSYLRQARLSQAHSAEQCGQYLSVQSIYMLICTSKKLTGEIREYVTQIQEAERESDGAVDYWTTVDKSPKCLADVVEAYIGAIFVDSEFNYGVVQQFFDMHLKPFFLDMYIYDPHINQHPLTRLRRRLEDELGCREHRFATHTSEKTLPHENDRVVAMVMIHDKVHFHGVASSGRYARDRVANIALERLAGLPEYEFERQYGCDCKEPVSNGED